MQKKLYIIAAGVLLLAGCAQFGNKNETPAAASHVTASIPEKTVSKDNASAISASGTTQASTQSANQEIVKEVKSVGSSTQETLVVSSLVKSDQPITYRVEIGDSLYSIARKNNISMICLSKANKITDPNKLAAGQTLVIPKSSDC